MGQLTTHVLDISVGLPAAGVRIDVHESGAPVSGRLTSAVTGADGRLAVPLLQGAALRVGQVTITFHIAEYFRSRGVPLPTPAFLETATITLGIASPEQHYHVPLLIAPWSYSVYRGG
jgi:hydroxyisourate hydrolase